MFNIIKTVWHFLPIVLEEFKEKGCQKNAAALTYMTLFAIVPLMTVTYSMFSVIPAFQGLGDQLQTMVFSHFMPETGTEVQNYLSDFSSQARNLSSVGVLMLVVTAYIMLKNIEKTFNNIWGVLRGRRGLSNFLLYWAILSLGPLLLGIGMAMSTYLISLKLFMKEYDSFGVVPWLLQFAPWLLTATAFTLLFAAVPNCKVPIKHAATGGVVTAICFELFKDLFGFIVTKTSISAIYGAFAFVPLFLMWINILWMIVLGGAVLVRTLTTYRARVIGHSYPDLVAALLALWGFKKRLASGQSATDSLIMSEGVETEQWQRIRDTLLIHNVIAVTNQGDYVLCRDLNTITLRDLADMVKMQSQMPGVSDYLQQFEWFPAVAGRLLSIDQHTEHEFDVKIGELLAIEAEPEEAYPDEGEGLEMLHEELGSVNPDAVREGSQVEKEQDEIARDDNEEQEMKNA